MNFMDPRGGLKYACMPGGHHVEICPFAIQFLGTYIIVMSVSLENLRDVFLTKCLKITNMPAGMNYSADHLYGL